MKKLILILAILALNVFAAGCRDYMRLSVSFWNFDEYHIDSVYRANYFGSLVYYTVLKLHYTNNDVDSLIRCVDVDDCEYMHVETITEKTDTSINKTIYIDGIFANEQLTSIDGGSSTYISYDMSKDTISDEEIESLKGDSSIPAYIRIIHHRVFFIDEIGINFLKNDTLYKTEMEKNTVITPDPSNENICNFTVYEPLKSDTAFITDQDIISEYQATITNTEKGFIVSFSNSDEKWFYILANEPTTSIHRKFHPAIIPEKSKKFDLLGRPAKSEHIIKVNR